MRPPGDVVELNSGVQVSLQAGLPPAFRPGGIKASPAPTHPAPPSGEAISC